MPDREQGSTLTDGPPRALFIVAVGIAVAAAAAVLVIAALRAKPPQDRTLVIPAVPAPQADSPECATLMATLPQRLGDYQWTTPAAPVPPATAAWRSGDTEPILLRCGVGRPADFVVGAPIQIVNTVQWFRVTDQGTGRQHLVRRRPAGQRRIDPAAGDGSHTHPGGVGRRRRETARGADQAGIAPITPQRSPTPLASAVSTIAASRVG